MGNNTLIAQWGERDRDNGTEAEVWAIGVQHAFSKRTRVYAEYIDSEDNAIAAGAAGADKDNIVIGLRHDF